MTWTWVSRLCVALSISITNATPQLVEKDRLQKEATSALAKYKKDLEGYKKTKEYREYQEYLEEFERKAKEQGTLH
jgi:uncharacterized membrane protein YgaE (UPF0421/DUF939 family)